MLHCSQGRTVFASGRDGMISSGKEGLFSWQTRLLSRYRYLVENEVPEAIAASSVEQHSWLGYYAFLPSDIKNRVEEKSIAQHTIELRVSRYVGGGIHEDIDLTNFTQFETSFT
ncbi:MAG TPA: glycogen debranching N-terminal domain-containing protein, partial [Acidobacteriaceae bacterium]|nr:glycogen debranching N-terminal domain-containing protein [Acidobacteriaceae bacterium]